MPRARDARRLRRRVGRLPAGAGAPVPRGGRRRLGGARGSPSTAPSSAPRRAIAVGGDSAGGNLAAVWRCAPATPACRCVQLLVYPVTDSTSTPESYERLATGLNLTRARWSGSGSTTSRDADGVPPRRLAAAGSDLSGVAPALVITAEYDPLRDEGEAYAHRLSQAGVAVTLSRYDGMIHGFFRMPGLVVEADDAIGEIAAAIGAL